MTNEDIINLAINWGPMLVILIIWSVYFGRLQKRMMDRQKEGVELSRRMADTLDRIEKKLNG